MFRAFPFSARDQILLKNKQLNSVTDVNEMCKGLLICFLFYDIYMTYTDTLLTRGLWEVYVCIVRSCIYIITGKPSAHWWFKFIMTLIQHSCTVYLNFARVSFITRGFQMK